MKTPSSRRRVLLHPELIKAGFLRYRDEILQTKVEKLFPGLRPDSKGSMTGNWGKWWGSVPRTRGDEPTTTGLTLERSNHYSPKRAASIKWFKPAKGQFQIYYQNGADHLEYQPDFVVETGDTIFMLEPKKCTELDDPIVVAKKEAAVKWCANASNHAASYGGKPWRYVLIPHDEIAENMTLDGLATRFA